MSVLYSNRQRIGFQPFTAPWFRALVVNWRRFLLAWDFSWLLLLRRCLCFIRAYWIFPNGSIPLSLMPLMKLPIFHHHQRIKPKNYGLDLARACAVAFVFFSHSLLTLYSSGIPYLWYGVFIGVELFFSLSGFLIGRMSTKQLFFSF